MLLYKQKHKKIGIFGLGITGIAIFESLAPISQNIICYSDEVNLMTKFHNHIIKDYILPIQNSKWKDLDLIVISPGISPEHKIFELATDNNIEISSDIELFYEEIYEQNPTVITVTGTNGKSSVCKLISHILQFNNLDCAIGGNIGVPVLSLPSNKKCYILELSSFQLSLIHNSCRITKKIGILLNIGTDHLDVHKNFSEYYNIKKKIFDNSYMQIICTDDNHTVEIFNELLQKPNHNIIRCVYSDNISPLNTNHQNIIYNHNHITYNNCTIDLNTWLKNTYPQNIAIIFAINQYFNLPLNDIKSAIQTFQPLKHRIEFVNAFHNTHYHKIQCYNDSKATNTHAAMFAMQHFNNIILLAGGIFKEEKISLPKTILSKIKHAYCFGKSKEQFSLLFTDHDVPVTICADMNEIFKYLDQQLDSYQSETTILLAPCCSSYDQFQNFEERGNTFKLLCNQLKNNYEQNHKKNANF